MTLQLQVDRSLVRIDGHSVRYVVASIEAPMRDKNQRRLPLNIALVIDRSGSMEGAKIVQAREAARYVVEQLQPSDRFAVVCYDDRIDVLVPSTRATPDACRKALKAIADLTHRSCTDLSGGWLTGCQQVAEHLGGETLNRCLLLTDGLANRGITDSGELRHHASELRVRGVVTSTFGIGEDFDEVLLSSMAEAGGGNFRLIRDAEEIPHLLRQELWEGLAVVAAEAVIEVRAPADVQITSLNDFPVSRSEPGVTHIRIGDLVSEQIIEPILAFKFPKGSVNRRIEASIRLLDRGAALGRPQGSISFTYATNSENDEQARNRFVDRRVAGLYAARAKRDALACNRRGEYEQARQIVERCCNRIETYAGTDEELTGLVAELRKLQSEYALVMDARTHKWHYSTSSSMLKGRSLTGSALYFIRRMGLVIVPCSKETEEASRIAISALAQCSASDLLGNLRLSTGWRNWPSIRQVGPALSPVQELQMVDSAEQGWPEDGMRLILTKAILADNGFSHWHPSGRTGIVSLSSFAEPIGIPLTAFIAYEILLYGLYNRSSRYDHERLMHSETKGCLFDLCPEKRDIEIKLQNLHVCPDCRRLLPSMDLEAENIEVVADVIRTMARNDEPDGSSKFLSVVTGYATRYAELLRVRPK